MQMARGGEIDLQDRPTASAKGWLSSNLRQRHYRRIVLLGFQWKGNKRLIAVDGEDSPFQLSDLLEVVDRYYTCTYCPYLFKEKQFRFALSWQTSSEISYYRRKAKQVIGRYGSYFGKVRHWAPIGPNLEWSRPQYGPFRTRIGKIRHRLELQCRGTVDWMPQYERFNARWAYLEGLRTLSPTLDIALLDSLWGWPRHRIALHKKLVDLAGQGYSIRSHLSYRSPESYELGDLDPPDPSQFPIQAGEPILGDYERLVAHSRLGVFATGFHYGWRNIVTLAWALGIQTLQDPFTYTFCFNPFHFYRVTTASDWSDLSLQIDKARLEENMCRRQRWTMFDQVASPINVARYVVDELCTELC
jgi:hypothetical protein